MRTLFTLSLCVFSTVLFAQQGHWEGTYGGAGFEDAHVVYEIPGEGYIVMGTSSSFGNGSNDCMIFKLDLSGNELWMKTHGGNGDEDAHYGIITNDGGFAMISYSNSFGNGDYDFYLIRMDENGDTLWTKTYGDSLDQYGYCMQETPDGGFVLVGKGIKDSTGYLDVWMIKTDITGNVEWEQYYGDSLDDYARFVELTDDGGYIIVGTTHNTDSGDAEVYLIKADSTGNAEWERSFDENTETFGYSVQQTVTGEYVISGYFLEPWGCWGQQGYNLVALKVDNNGSELWRKTPFYNTGGPDCKTHVAHSLKETSDGGYIITGGTYVEYVCKTSADPDSGLYISNLLMLKLNADGSTSWSREYYPTFSSGQIELGTYGIETTDGGYIFCAYQGYDYHTDGQVLVVKTDSLGLNVGLSPELNKAESILRVYPTPGKDVITITMGSEKQGSYSIFDIGGRRTTISGDLKDMNTVVNIKSLSPGLYNVIVDLQEGRYTRKITITK